MLTARPQPSLSLGRRLLPVPPDPVGFDQFAIDVCSVQEKELPKAPLVLVMAVAFNSHMLSEYQVGGGLPGPVTEGLACLGAIDVSEADTLWHLVVAYLDPVPVEDSDHRPWDVKSLAHNKIIRRTEVASVAIKCTSLS